jgi:GT2 family glycosyltransferase/glycosyltransferase involved in cell wall biosynthesis
MPSTELASLGRSRELISHAIASGAESTLVLCRRLVCDELAAAGARELLRGTPHRELGLDELAAARGDTALLLGGCFARGDHVMPRALAVAELRFETVIVLPSSFDPSDDAVHRVLSRTRAIVFAREPDSYRAIADLCDARLAHDCTFFLDLSAHVREGQGALDIFGDITESDLGAWLDHIAAHETVRTDRARVMIAAALMGKRVEYTADAELGADAIARHALADLPVTRIASPGSEAPLAPEPLDAAAEQTLVRLSAVARATAPAERAAPVTAVVLTRDRPAMLQRTLESLDGVRTLVIDNNSAPGPAHALQAICEGRRAAELHRSERNLGCAGGRRLGASLVDTELVLFLDDDAELMPGALDHLVGELANHPDAGAVTATVVRPDGTLLHSGGSMNVTDEIVTFELLYDGVTFSPADLAPSGPSGWAPGGALLARRELLAEFPFDETMGAYFEDNEWAYRVSRARPGSFRRSREALVLHHAISKHAPAADFASRARMVELLASYARFYELHGLLLGPWLFDHVPELRAADGSCDLAAARLLMELVGTKGTDWTLMAWMNGDLDVLLSANRRLVAANRRLLAADARVARERAEIAALRARAARDAGTIAFFEGRLRRVEESVTWQLIQRVRESTVALLGGEQSRAVRLIQRVLRLIGRGLLGHRLRSSVRGASTRLVRASRALKDPIDFSAVEEPDVSIVIPLYDHAGLTAAALRSIRDHTEAGSYEVILVDDSDDAPTKALLERVRGARVIVNDSNLGYRRSVERGAEAARGRWLVLCNNDIEVQPAWLKTLLECGESHPDIAIVAPKYLYPDGSLAEAGGIIWRDGTGVNYGRGDHPESCHYEYRRDIDYGSAAALLVRASFWRDAGGFDGRFDPMYYEDTDLCFEARRRGLRVVYEPRAQVIHDEGATAGVDVTAGYKRHQEQNRPKFVEKWHELLEAEHLKADQASDWLAANFRRRARVLVIDHRVPTWDRDSGSLRMRGMLDALIELGCHVSLLPDNGAPTPPYTRELQRMRVEVLYGDDLPTALARIGPDVSLVILCRAEFANRWLERVRTSAPSAPVVFDTVDLHWLREARRAALGAGANGGALPRGVAALRKLELDVIRAADATLVVTDSERRQVLQDVPGAKVFVVPNVNQVRADVLPAGGREGVLFVGGFEHLPNIDGARALVGDVMPLVWRDLPDVPVKIVGPDPPESVSALASSRVDVAGWVPDLDPLLDSARVLVAPLTYGAGLKGKVTQALAHGLPVVTTSVGAEGLDAVDGEHMLIAEAPADLAARVLRVLLDDGLWDRLSRSGQVLIADSCSPEVVRERLRAVLEELRCAQPVTEAALSPR